VPVRDIFAELVDGCGAVLLHGELEIDVLRHVHLLIEQGGTALVTQILTPANRKGSNRNRTGGDSVSLDLMSTLNEMARHL
jgi:hypothetical protein